MVLKRRSKVWTRRNAGSAELHIIVCYRMAFYPCFLQFAIKQDRRTLPSVLDAGHSWADYIYSLPTLYGVNQPVRNLIDYLGISY